MKKRVIYDDVIFRLQRVGGISAVFYQLISHFSNDETFDCQVVSSKIGDVNNFYWEKLDKKVFNKKILIPKYILQFIPYLFILYRGKFIFHSSYYNFPLFKLSSLKYVITIHDLGYEHGIMQTGFKRRLNIWFKKLAIQRADGIICVSKTTYIDLQRFYGQYLYNKKIEVIYNGLNDKFLNQDFSNLSFGSKSILYVGGRQRYKNFYQVVKALSMLDEFELIVLGGGELSLDHKRFLDTTIPGKYKFYNDVSDDILINYYRTAFCLIYPSSFEGFGIPIIEAMSCSCPVIGCSNSSIIEVARDNAVLISDALPGSIVKGVKQLQDEDFRLKLIERAFVYSKSFRWQINYIKTKLFYTEILN